MSRRVLKNIISWICRKKWGSQTVRLSTVVIRTGNRLLHSIEKLTVDCSDKALVQRPVFIIGAPRSGSTVLYQAMLNYFDFGYITNLHCMFYGAPALAERVTRISAKRGSVAYQSEFGRTKGLSAPSECGAFWYRFFRRYPQYIPLTQANPKSLAHLRGSIRALGNAMGKPLLLKNLPCALRLAPLSKAFPEALYIVVNRNEGENAHSLLEARMKLSKTYDSWLSLEPPNIEYLKRLPVHEQAVEQIRSIHDVINEGRAMIGDQYFMGVNYEDFCNAPQLTMELVDQFLMKHDVQVAKRQVELPSFQQRTQVRIEASLYQNLLDYVTRGNA